MAHITRPLPTITQDSQEFWASTHDHAMKLQRCDRCGRFWYYPGPVCHYCGSTAFTWTPVSGKGTIYSYSLLERARGNPFEGDVPIAIILVRLEEGPVMMSNLVDYGDGDLAVDAAVEVTYEDVTDEVTLPVFRPAAR
ncbi:Zn-ribbon domain-containing OB-fold protein [Nakamurella endophytica]|uniref:DNA-binding protein n=1 Tax=Nakamurella endophytica TaxID=1748367 RepID=A0A917SSF7_9ACTN|nr:OB-fold domain-containing protein [Nakamurella endophytica]GGL94666.1 DNA-binding protein [Nakamurella endophytica]